MIIAWCYKTITKAMFWTIFIKFCKSQTILGTTRWNMIQWRTITISALSRSSFFCFRVVWNNLKSITLPISCSGSSYFFPWSTFRFINSFVNTPFVNYFTSSPARSYKIFTWLRTCLSSKIINFSFSIFCNFESTFFKVYVSISISPKI